MFDALSFAEIDAYHVELLPARTVLSLFAVSGGGHDGSGDGHGDDKTGCVASVTMIDDGHNSPGEQRVVQPSATCTSPPRS